MLGDLLALAEGAQRIAEIVFRRRPGSGVTLARADEQCSAECRDRRLQHREVALLLADLPQGLAKPVLRRCPGEGRALGGALLQRSLVRRDSLLQGRDLPGAFTNRQ